LTPRASFLTSCASRIMGRVSRLPPPTGAAPTSTTVAAWVLTHLVTHLASAGHETSPLRRLPGFRGRSLDDPDARVSDAAAVEAWRLAERISGDDAIGLHLARTIPAGALDLLEYAFRSSTTLAGALEALARYGRVVSDRAAARLAQGEDAVTVTFGAAGGAPHERQRTEFALAFVVRLAREATGTALSPSEVRFAHPAPESLFEHRAFFRAPLRFEQPDNAVAFSRADTARTLRGADAALEGVVRRRLEKMLSQLNPEDDSTGARVRRRLLATMAGGDVTAAAIARELGMSERSLHRRLRAEGTWFRGVLDAVRGELATALLKEPGIAIAEIAFFLGYSEAAAFHRSFRRWTGLTPRAFRRAQAAA
jgi:AraC-like DNA-binding protein